MAKKNFKSGFVVIIGRPNVGKSTLLNALLGSKISIVSPVPQTTRYNIKGILNLANAQIVFVDPPGIHSFKDDLVRHLNTLAKQALEGCDLVVYLVDTSRPVGREEEAVVDILLKQEAKVIIALNKCDLGKKFLNDYINLWQDKQKAAGSRRDSLIYYLPLSAKTLKNVDALKDIIVENLPVGPAFYDQDTVTDFPLKFRVADIIREKLFLNLQDELPHSLAVEVESIEDKKKVIYVKAAVYVNRVSQRKIIIGQNGEGLKKVGAAARQEIEKIYNKKVYLDIWVKIIADWQARPRILQELGYH